MFQMVPDEGLMTSLWIILQKNNKVVYSDHNLNLWIKHAVTEKGGP